MASIWMLATRTYCFNGCCSDCFVESEHFFSHCFRKGILQHGLCSLAACFSTDIRSSRLCSFRLRWLRSSMLSRASSTEIVFSLPGDLRQFSFVERRPLALSRNFEDLSLLTCASSRSVGFQEAIIAEWSSSEVP